MGKLPVNFSKSLDGCGMLKQIGASGFEFRFYLGKIAVFFLLSNFCLFKGKLCLTGQFTLGLLFFLKLCKLCSC